MRRTQCILLDLGVEPGHHLARRDHIAHIDGPLDHAPVEAEGEARLILGANLPCQRDGLALRTTLDGDRPDGPGLRSRWCPGVEPQRVAAITLLRAIRNLNIGTAPHGG